MTDLIITPLEVIDNAFTQYELPPEGISSLGYIVRRMHKTSLLSEVHSLMERQLYPYALAQIAHYAAASSATFGHAPYEPRPDRVGACIMERDPQTNAIVMATKENTTPANCYSCLIKLPTGDMFIGHKTEGASHFKLRGWETPTIINLAFTSADEHYQAELHGTLFHEQLPRLVGAPLIRAYGELKLYDNQDNYGTLALNRKAEATITISNNYGRTSLKHSIILS